MSWVRYSLFCAGFWILCRSIGHSLGMTDLQWIGIYMAGIALVWNYFDEP